MVWYAYLYEGEEERGWADEKFKKFCFYFQAFDWRSESNPLGWKELFPVASIQNVQLFHHIFLCFAMFCLTFMETNLRNPLCYGNMISYPTLPVTTKPGD